MSRTTDDLMSDLFGVTEEDRQRWDAMRESEKSSRRRADQMGEARPGLASRAISRGLDLAERGIMAQLTADQVEEMRGTRAKVSADGRVRKSRNATKDDEADFELG